MEARRKFDQEFREGAVRITGVAESRFAWSSERGAGHTITCPCGDAALTTRCREEYSNGPALQPCDLPWWRPIVGCSSIAAR